MRSRIVPPPMAVAMPTIHAPKMSNRFVEDRRTPEMAKANVPMNSMTTNVTGSLSVSPMSCRNPTSR